MKRYGVTLEGINYEIRKESGPALLGFYTTRYVSAENETEAELNAVKLVKEDKTLLNMTVRNSEQVPTLRLEEIWEVSMEKELGGSGYTFFPMEEA